MSTTRSREQGKVQGSTIIIVVLTLLFIAAGAAAIWFYMQYAEQKRDVDSKVSVAEAKAKLDQRTEDEEAFAEREKEPMREFVGPADYGRLSFDYPKTWSAFEETDVSKGGGVEYRAYLHPRVVPPISETSKVALRVSIQQKTYDQSLETYAKLLKAGTLKSAPFDNGALTGTRLTGNFNKDLIGTAVLVKMRDRTLTMRTDGDVFMADFEALLKTVTFNE